MNTTINNQDTRTLPTITPETTLGEILSLLNLGEKPHETPTPKTLHETAGYPIASYPDPLGFGEGGILYANGNAVWDNGSGRTVIWLPDCVSFTHYFVKPKESEIGICPEKDKTPDGMLESEKWSIAVTLIGEHRIENLAMQRKGDRKQNKSLIRGDNEEGDALDEQEESRDSLRDEYSWREGRFGENPEDAYIRKETQEEMLSGMTDKQREVFVLYYQYGYKQREIAEITGMARTTVMHHLDGALKKIKKALM